MSSRTCFWVPLLLALAAACPAIDAMDFTVPEDEYLEAAVNDARERAARYRLERERALPGLDPTYHAAAADALAFSRELLEAGEVGTAYRLARDANRRYPYSEAAAGLMHQLFRCTALAGDYSQARRHLIDTNERFPAYADIDVLMQEGLLVAELVQAHGPFIDLDAPHPREVIDEEMILAPDVANPYFYYLSLYGDRHHIAPRATLGLARSFLIKGSDRLEKLGLARHYYERFLDRFPSHELAFTALCEYALSYLIAYRGDVYDLGVVQTAKSIIEHQARHHANEIPERLALIEQYRALIRRWWQDRDLQVGRWYLGRERYAAAAIYFRQVVARDSQSQQGRTALRLLGQAQRRLDSGEPAE